MTYADLLDLIRAADAVVVSTSAGKDSHLAMARAARAVREAGSSARLVAVHADMGRQEWGSKADAPEGYFAGTPGELAAAQAAHYGFEFVVERREQGDLLDQAAEKGAHPRVGASHCQGTSDHKRGPIYRAYTAVASEWREAGGSDRRDWRPCRIVEVTGLAAHESSSRARRLGKQDTDGLDGRIAYNPKASGKGTVRQVTTWNPIADVADEAAVWDEVWDEVWAGAPAPHWAYGVGMPRLSCAICVHASFDGLVLAGRHNTGLLEQWVEIERGFERPWSSRFTLADVLDAVRRGDDISDITWADAA